MIFKEGDIVIIREDAIHELIEDCIPYGQAKELLGKMATIEEVYRNRGLFDYRIRCNSATWGVHESSLSPAHLETILEEFNTLLS